MVLLLIKVSVKLDGMSAAKKDSLPKEVVIVKVNEREKIRGVR